MWVRSASVSDLQAVHKLLLETWHATYDDILGREMVTDVTNQWHSLAVLQKNLSKPYSEFVVADDGEGRIVGMAFARQSEKNRAFLHQLYVLPESQLQGIGTMLLSEVEMAFPDVGTIRLEAIERNERAIRFFEQKDYKRVGRNEDWGSVTSKEPVLILEKQLSSWSI